VLNVFPEQGMQAVKFSLLVWAMEQLVQALAGPDAILPAEHCSHAIAPPTVAPWITIAYILTESV
jgi:hypothetical protein